MRWIVAGIYLMSLAQLDEQFFISVKVELYVIAKLLQASMHW